MRMINCLSPYSTGSTNTVLPSCPNASRWAGDPRQVDVIKLTFVLRTPNGIRGNWEFHCVLHCSASAALLKAVKIIGNILIWLRDLLGRLTVGGFFYPHQISFSHFFDSTWLHPMSVYPDNGWVDQSPLCLRTTFTTIIVPPELIHSAWEINTS